MCVNNIEMGLFPVISVLMKQTTNFMNETLTDLIRVWSNDCGKYETYSVNVQTLLNLSKSLFKTNWYTNATNAALYLPT